MIYHRYIIFNLLLPFLVISFSLTAIIWLSQSLRFVDLIINKGLDVSTFLYLSLLLVPSLSLIILPVALFISVLYIYNKLTQDSELLVLKSSGVSGFGLTIPALYMSGFVAFLGYLISLYILPVSYTEFKNLQDFIRNNYASVLLQEGVFTTPIDRFTVYIESRDLDGTPRGILVHDARDKDSLVTYIAQSGQIIQDQGVPKVYLVNGNIQKVDKRNGSLSLVYFDSYPLDLSIYGTTQGKRLKVPEERYLYELFSPEDVTAQNQVNSLIAEGHHRILWPFIPVSLALMAMVVLFSGQLNRRGQWKRLFLASILAVVLIIMHFALKSLVAVRPYLFVLLYLNILLPAFYSLKLILNGKTIQIDLVNNIYKILRGFHLRERVINLRRSFSIR